MSYSNFDLLEVRAITDDHKAIYARSTIPADTLLGFFDGKSGNEGVGDMEITIVNDGRALTAEPRALEVAAAGGAAVVLMHCLGEPKTMQQAPTYDHVTLDIFDYLAARIGACEAAGIPRAKIAIDPGIGFGKTLDHNLQILRDLALYQSLGCPLLLGVSRKSFIGRLSGERSSGAPPQPKARLPGSLAAALAGLEAGANLLRVHDVSETVQAVAVWRALHGAATSG